MDTVITWLEGKKTFIVNALILIAGLAEKAGVIHTGLSEADAFAILAAVNIVLRFFTKGKQTVVPTTPTAPPTV